jgi:hypothetical protein
MLTHQDTLMILPKYFKFLAVAICVPYVFIAGEIFPITFGNLVELSLPAFAPGLNCESRRQCFDDIEVRELCEEFVNCRPIDVHPYQAKGIVIDRPTN